MDDREREGTTSRAEGLATNRAACGKKPHHYNKREQTKTKRLNV